MGLRKKISLVLIFLVLVVSGVVFYYRFPYIWGSVVYPLKYEEVIKKCAKDYNLPPSLIAGVIFTESRFNENAVSRMGAIGLMQIMPKTGARLAKILNEPNYSTSKLYEPATNIKFGSYYVKELINRHQGDISKALIAYNGGESAVISFERRATLPRETSNFVRRVRGMWETYEKVYGAKWQETPEAKDRHKAEMDELSRKIKEAESRGQVLKAEEEGKGSILRRIWNFFIYGITNE